MIFRFVILLFFSFSVALSQSATPDSWSRTKEMSSGTIVAYWYESKPFIYKDANGNMQGIENEVMKGFIDFVRSDYNIKLNVVWKEAKSFGDTYESIRVKQENGTFGISAFSITPERRRYVDFTMPYMADISVLITSENIPIVKNSQEFNSLFSRLTAITIQQTTYERDILNLKRDRRLPFKIKYIPSSENVMRTIEKNDSAFGFIDLPIYLMLFNENPSIKVKRQNLFPIKREGYAFMMPQSSDWHIPMDAYFSSDNFKPRLEKIISKYFEVEVYHFIESLSIQSNEDVVLLTKEKEIQYKDLLGKSQQIAIETQRRNFLMALVAVVSILLILIFIFYYKRNRDHQILSLQKEQIETQRQNIETQNMQLEKRNERLIALNDEKNNLIKILAHDLRTPINHVQGLAQLFLLKNTTLSNEQQHYIKMIIDASLRLNKMINNILDVDAIENDRVNLFMDEVDVCLLVENVVKTFEDQASKKEIALKFTPEDEAVYIKGDTLLLTQIFENLVSNGLKFSEKHKQIDIDIIKANTRVLIKITDPGPGISAEEQELLFIKYQRLTAQPTQGERSTGLGLSIVKKYVELMNGRVWCESKLGNGASFIIEFPIV